MENDGTGMSLSATIRTLVLACAVLAATAFAPSWAGARADEHGTVCVAAELSGDQSRTSLTFMLSKAVTPNAFLMQGPNRVIVDLPEVNFQLPAATKSKHGLVSSFRYGLFAPGRSRIVIDLDRPARVAQIGVNRRQTDGAYLMTIDLARTDAESFRRAVEADSAAAREASRTAGRTAEAPAGDMRPTVVIDAGHGGIDPGATASTGALEKDIVFAFAERLRERLTAGGQFRVIMTRDRDIFVPLGERVRIAQRAKADLFVSIHADSISSAPQVGGLTVYTGSERASDTESATLADRENQADSLAGADGSENADEVADILRDLTLRETRGYSHRFASRLVEKLDGVARLNKNPHRQAGFRVLRAADVPSVLVELGYLSSRKDIDLLMSDAWRDKATEAMREAIGRYFSTRLANQRGAAVSP